MQPGCSGTSSLKTTESLPGPAWYEVIAAGEMLIEPFQQHHKLDPLKSFLFRWEMKEERV
jgi:hypothetical protein